MATYPNSSTNLYLQVQKNKKNKKNKNLLRDQGVTCIFFKHSRASVWFQVNCVEAKHGNKRCYLSWKKKTYAEPTQAMTQISQRMWHDHGPSSLSISLRTHKPLQSSLAGHFTQQAAPNLLTDSPGRVGGGDEEVDGHPVAHMETLLHLPTQQHTDPVSP